MHTLVIFFALFSAAAQALPTNATEAQVAEAPYELLGLRPHQASLADAILVFGAAKPTAVPDHGHDFNALCYRGKNAKVVLEEGFFVPGKLGHIVLTEKVVPKALKKVPCVASEKLDADVRTTNGLGVGLTKAELEKILGAPTATKKGQLTWDWTHYHPYSDAEKAKRSPAPGGKSYKGEYRYLRVDAALVKDRVASLDITFSGETDW